MKLVSLTLLALLANAQETPTERDAAHDVLSKMSDLQHSIDAPTIVERLMASNPPRDQVAARAKELMEKEHLDRKAALKLAARERGLSKREAYKQLLIHRDD